MALDGHVTMALMLISVAGLLGLAITLAIWTRKLHYSAWIVALVLLMGDVLTGNPIAEWLFYAAMGVTLILQVRDSLRGRATSADDNPSTCEANGS